MNIVTAGTFSTEQAATLAGLTAQRLTDWDRYGFLRASVPAKRRGISRRYTFRDIVALRVASELRDAGVSMQTLRKVVEHLRNREGLSATDVLASTNLVTNGTEVYEQLGDVTIHVPSGQRAFFHVIPLHVVVREVQLRARELSAA